MLKKKLLVRWVMFFPTPYWIDRFNYLAEREEIDFECIFQASGSTLQGWQMDRSEWRFRYEVLKESADNAGYFAFKFRIPNPWALLRGKFDVLVISYGEMNSLIAAAMCVLLGRPYYLFAPNTKYEQRSISFLRESVKSLVFKFAKGTLATGVDQKEYASQYVKNPASIRVVGNPTQRFGDLARFAMAKRLDLRADFGFSEDFVLLYVGRLSPEKGLSVLLKAMSKCCLVGIDPLLVLVGSGPLEDTLRREAADLGVRVDFAGFHQKRILVNYYAAADVFVLPSVSEAWGLVVNEAMEFGLPVIISDRVGCANELIRDGENGYISPLGDVDALAARIIGLFRNNDLRRKMGELSKEVVFNHSIGRWSDAIVSAVCDR